MLCAVLVAKCLILEYWKDKNVHTVEQWTEDLLGLSFKGEKKNHLKRKGIASTKFASEFYAANFENEGSLNIFSVQLEVQLYIFVL